MGRRLDDHDPIVLVRRIVQEMSEVLIGSEEAQVIGLGMAGNLLIRSRAHANVAHVCCQMAIGGHERYGRSGQTGVDHPARRGTLTPPCLSLTPTGGYSGA